MFIVWSRQSDLVEKIISPVIFDPNRSLKRQKALSSNKYLLIKVSMARRSHLVFFYFKEKFCVSALVGQSLARYLSSSAYMAFRPCRKKCISGYIWHKSFIQTVECSFSNQITVYQSFSGTLLTVSYFLLKEKFCVLADGSASLWLARDVYCLKRSEDLVKKIVSPVMFDTNCSFKQ